MTTPVESVSALFCMILELLFTYMYMVGLACDRSMW